MAPSVQNITSANSSANTFQQNNTNQINGVSNETASTEFSDYYDSSLTFTIFDSLLSLPVTATDVLIIIVLTRFSILKTKRNILILSWAIINMILTLTAPSKFILLFHSLGAFIVNIYYIPIYNIYMLSEIYQILYILMLFVDTFYKKTTFESLKKLDKMIWASYVAFAMGGIIAGILNHHDLTLFFFLYLITAFLLYGTFIGKICYSLFIMAKSKKMLKIQIRFLLTAGYIIGSFLWFIFTLASFATHHTKHSYYVQVCGDLFLLVSNCNPVLQVLILYFYDNDFKNCVDKLLCYQNSEDRVSYENEATSSSNRQNVQYGRL